MANLTGQNISSSYQQLVTLGTGTTITNGTGSLITNLAVTASWAQNAVTASFALNAGSQNTGSLMVTGSVSSNVLTFTKGDGSAFNLTVNTGSAVAPNTGSLMVTGSATNNVITFTKGDGSTFNVTVATGSAVTVNTGSLMVTGSVASNVLTFTKGDGSTFNLTVATGSTAVTASYALNAERLGGDLPAFYATATSVTNLSSSVASRLTIDEAIISGLTAATSSYALKTEVSGAFASTSASFSTRLTTDEAIITSLVAATGSYALKTEVSGAFNSVSSSFATRLTTDEAIITSLVAATSSYARTNVNNTFTGTQTFDNIAVNGTASIAYLQSVTGSAKIIGDAFIILNNDTPALRYAGIKVIDSGSANVTASFLFDGQTNDWFYEYQSGDPTNFGVVLFGPEYGTLGSPIYPTANQLQKGTGGHHMTGSNISDDGALVTISVPVSVTGAVTASAGFSGNLVGNASTATSASFATTASYLSGQVPTLSGELQFNNVIGEIYGSVASPVTGNLTISSTSLKRNGSVAVVFHTGSTEPTVTGGTIAKKTGIYSGTDLNVISFTNVDGTNYIQGIAGAGITTVPSASVAISASYALTASFATTASFASFATSASFAPSTPAFPFTGSAIITGSLIVTGSTNLNGRLAFANTATGGVIISNYTGSMTSQTYTLIGNNIVEVAETGTDNVQIGHGSRIVNGSRNNAVVIGAGTSAAQDTVLIGGSGTANVADGVAVGKSIVVSGDNGVGIGSGANVAGAGAIGIGKSIVTTAAGEINIGNKFRFNSGSNGIINLVDDVSVSGSVTATSFIGTVTSASYALFATTAETANTASYVTGQAEGGLTGDLQFTNILGEIYGNAFTPTTGSITISAISTKRQGAVAVVFHTGSSEPAVSGGTVAKKVGNYSTTDLNVITFTKLVGNNYLEYIAGAPVTSVVSASYAVTASFAQNAANIFPFTGAAVISGSLNISGSVGASNVVMNNTDTFTSSAKIQEIVTCTQAEYNSVSGSANASQTLYVITDATGGGQFVSGSLTSNVNALTIASTTASLNCQAGNFFTLTLAASANTFLNPTNIQAGQTINLRVTQPTPNTGSISFASTIKQVSGSAYTPTALASAVDILTFVAFDTSSLNLANLKKFV